MSILKWKNPEELVSIKDEIDQLFNKMFETAVFHSWEERYALMSSGISSPQFTAQYRGEDFVIQSEMPGFERGDIKVSVSGNLLAIGSEVSREREFNGNNAYRYHRSQGSFCKIMELPAGLNAGGIKTSFRNGILEVIIPKAGSTVVSTESKNALPDLIGETKPTKSD